MDSVPLYGDPAVGDGVSGAALAPSVQESVPSPLPVSFAATFTVTGNVLFHPAKPFAVCDTVTVGLVLSSTRSNCSSLKLPAESVAFTSTTYTPSGFPVNEIGFEPLEQAGVKLDGPLTVIKQSAIPLPLSVTVTDTGVADVTNTSPARFVKLGDPIELSIVGFWVSSGA